MVGVVVFIIMSWALKGERDIVVSFVVLLRL